ncbi:hypothetical protein [Asaia lannensis]|uniref:hypothetical protein n=1 Tax=Asaia lannensis TaxID=415421 RepID=UPI0038730AB4
MSIMNLFRTPYVRRLEAENDRLRIRLWKEQNRAAPMLALVASKNKEIEELKKSVRDLNRERDRGGRFTHG